MPTGPTSPRGRGAATLVAVLPITGCHGLLMRSGTHFYLLHGVACAWAREHTGVNDVYTTNFFITHMGELAKRHDGAVIRPLFARHCRDITTGAELRASLRAGPYVWPGGYALAYVTTDGATLCHACARTEFAQCAYALRHNVRNGWHITGVMSEADTDDTGVCDHCGHEIWPGHAAN